MPQFFPIRYVTAPPTPPQFPAGVWVDITPPIDGFADTFGIPHIAMAPSDRAILYACCDDRGLYKTVNRGQSWTLQGTPETYNFDGSTTFLDSPIRTEIHPTDPSILYATQGVRGSTLGWWRTTNSGANWVMPAGFISAAASATNDVTFMAVDPTDFDHVLVGSHSPWSNPSRTAGIMRTQDGGDTWTLIEAESTWGTGTFAIGFLYDPASEQGDSSTWIVATDGDGFWRTTNAGTSWTQVSTINVVHGGCQFTYGPDGTLYCGAQPYPMRSTDNGVTWAQMTDGMPNAFYYSVISDGANLYTQLSNTGDNAGRGPQAYMTTAEPGTGTWTAYPGGQTFNNGPYQMVFDAANDMIYSANWKTGVWALKVVR